MGSTCGIMAAHRRTRASDELHLALPAGLSYVQSALAVEVDQVNVRSPTTRGTLQPQTI